MTKNRITIKEDDIVKDWYSWFYMQYERKKIAFCHHSPNEYSSAYYNYNGGKRIINPKMMGYEKKMKSMGKKTGFPDELIICKNSLALLEFKTKTGRLAPSQKNIIDILKLVGFTNHYIVRSYDEAVEVTKEFINNVLTRES